MRCFDSFFRFRLLKGIWHSLTNNYCSYFWTQRTNETILVSKNLINKQQKSSYSCYLRLNQFKFFAYQKRTDRDINKEFTVKQLINFCLMDKTKYIKDYKDTGPSTKAVKWLASIKIRVSTVQLLWTIWRDSKLIRQPFCRLSRK